MQIEMFLFSLSPMSNSYVPSPAGTKCVCICRLPSWICKSSLSRLQVSLILLLFSILASPGRHPATWGNCCWAFCSVIIRTAWTLVRPSSISSSAACLYLLPLHGTACSCVHLAGASRGIQTPGFYLEGFSVCARKVSADSSTVL